MKVTIIVAAAENGVIGDGRLPWHLGSDLRFFKQLTLGHPVIMGRKTYEAIGKPLPGRTNIILTRQLGYIVPPGCIISDSIYDAIMIAGKFDDECFVIGGEEVYRQSIGMASTLYLTNVHCSPVGKATFLFNKSLWQDVAHEDHEADENNDYSFTRITYQRIGK